MKVFKNFTYLTSAVAIIALLVFSCNKEKEPITAMDELSSGCDYEYNADGYIVQEDGILNFSDAEALAAFLDTMPQLTDSLFAVWEANSGSYTAYGNYIKAEAALDVLLLNYENASGMDSTTFRSIFNTFSLNKASLASITDEGIEPLYSFPFYYFVNEDGIYRICDEEYSISGSLLFSYPVGKQDLVASWNGEIGEFGELSVQRIQRAYSSENIQDRDEEFHTQCTSALSTNGNKRIRVFWDSSAFRQSVPNPPGPNATGY